ncbi:MAG: hypothetical protein QOK26_3502 [Pseudonocardiales bacterium]|nr:hypothetical protein [Pseudonocardiales bacterium]
MALSSSEGPIPTLYRPRRQRREAPSGRRRSAKDFGRRALGTARHSAALLHVDRIITDQQQEGSVQVRRGALGGTYVTETIEPLEKWRTRPSAMREHIERTRHQLRQIVFGSGNGSIRPTP